MKYLFMLLLSAVTLVADAQNAGNDAGRPYATLYVYRPKNFEGSAISYSIKVNNEVVGKIRNNSKFETRIYTPGPAEITAETEQARKIKLNVEMGKSYYLKCGITTGFWVGRPEINLVYPEQGKLDYENLEVKKRK